MDHESAAQDRGQTSPSRDEVVLRSLSEWNEDVGDVLWWKFPVDEPPYVGTPNDTGYPVLVQIRTSRDQKEHALPSITAYVGGWPGYHTHWTPLSIPDAPAALRAHEAQP